MKTFSKKVGAYFWDLPAHSHICDRMLVYGSVFCLVILAANGFRFFQFGWQPIIAIQVLLSVVLWGVTVFRRFLSYRIRAGTILGLLFVASLAGIWVYGFSTQGIIIFMSVAVLATILFDLKTGIFVMGAVVATIAIVGANTVLNHRLPPVAIEAYLTSASAWVFATITGLMVMLGLMVIVGALMQQFEETVEALREKSAALKANEERFTLANRGSKDGLWDWDVKTGTAYYSKMWSEMLGYSADELAPTHETFESLLHPDDRQVIENCPVEVIAGEGDILENEFRLRHKTGRWVNILSRGFLVHDNGEAIRIVGTHVDITDRKRAESALKQTEDMLFESIEAMPLGFAYYDTDDKLVLFNENYRTLLPVGGKLLREGMSFETLARHTASIFAEAKGYKDAEEYIQDRIKSPRGDEKTWIYKLTTGRWISSYERGTLNGGFISIIEDITESKMAQEYLQASEKRLKQALHVADAASWEVDAQGRLTWSPEVFEMFQVDPKTFDGSLQFFHDFVHPDDRETVRSEYDLSLSEGRRYNCTHRIVLQDGTEKIVRENAEPIWGEQHQPMRMCGVVQDITEMVELETKLYQAQKMEAIGQLTGGIAHDFNNLLAVIQGNAELLDDLGGAAPALTSTILRATRRGAELTHRLLAFSRQQPLNPVPIDLCDLVSDLLNLLTRSLGETIEIETILPETLWTALADPGQVENALLNLAINARDAMPDGGKLTIECANITIEDEAAPNDMGIAIGDYLVLSVTDQGIGMSEGDRLRAFEPFFTTKDVGKGSGLGLSMVYGFAQQSRGQVIIYSELAIGTTVKLYLPRAAHNNEKPETTSKETAPMGGGETILVIEDDSDVRELTQIMLTRLGYQTLIAEGVEEARQLLLDTPNIHLVLSDVVLSGEMSGPDFAVELKTHHPEISVIFMSGYPAEAAKHNGFLESDNALLSKPFRFAELATAVREALLG